MRMSRKQMRLLNLRDEEADIIVVPGPFQCGKTHALCWGFTRLVASFPDPEADFIIAAQRQSLVVGTMLKGIEAACEHHGLAFEPYNSSKGYAKIEDHRVFAFIGANEGSGGKLRGHTVAGVWVDEVTQCNEEFVKEAIGRTSVEGAKTILSTNPAGPGHWLKRDYIDRPEEMKAVVIPFQMSDRPGIPPEYIERIRRNYTGAAQRRYLYGEWIAFEGSIFPSFRPILPPEDLVPVQYDLTLDFGSSSVTHCNLIATMEDGRKWAVEEYVYERNSPEQDPFSCQEITEDIARRVEDKNIAHIVVDDAATHMKAAMRDVFGLRSMKPLANADRSIVEGIHRVTAYLESGQFNVSPLCVKTVRAMDGYVWDDKKVDTPLKDGIHDHAVDALRYYIQRMNKPRYRATRI